MAYPQRNWRRKVMAELRRQGTCENCGGPLVCFGGCGQTVRRPEQEQVKQRCETCRFVREIPHTVRDRECHRYPPNTRVHTHGFPPTDADGWCGEWCRQAISETKGDPGQWRPTVWSCDKCDSHWPKEAVYQRDRESAPALKTCPECSGIESPVEAKTERNEP